MSSSTKNTAPNFDAHKKVLQDRLTEVVNAVVAIPEQFNKDKSVSEACAAVRGC